MLKKTKSYSKIKSNDIALKELEKSDEELEVTESAYYAIQ